MSRYHVANTLLSAAPNTTSGFYGKWIKDTIAGTQDMLLRFATLTLHRLVEEHRFAVMFAEIELGNDIYITHSPETENPDESAEGNNIRKWTDTDILHIRRKHIERDAKIKNLGERLEKISMSFEAAVPWLSHAIPIYAKHMSRLDEISPKPNNRERKKMDRDRSLRNPKFDPNAPKVHVIGEKSRKKKRNLFADRPEADDWTLKQWSNIYKHGSESGQLKPMSFTRDNHQTATLLDRRIGEMRGKPADGWARDMVNDGTHDPHPAFLDAVHELLMACEMAITEDEAMLAQEWQKIDEIDRGQMWKAGAKAKPKKEWDWSRFKGIRDKHTSEERVERRKRRYKRDKRGRFTK